MDEGSHIYQLVTGKAKRTRKTRVLVSFSPANLTETWHPNVKEYTNKRT